MSICPGLVTVSGGVKLNSLETFNGIVVKYMFKGYEAEFVGESGTLQVNGKVSKVWRTVLGICMERR